MDDMSLEEARRKIGGPGVSDEELLLRCIMGGTEEMEAMRAAGPPKQYFSSNLPLLTLLEELKKHSSVRHVQVQRGSDSIVVQNRANAPASPPS